ncbi:MAG: YggS family pyridoxal phosphate-dependent enzyme, partial [Rhodospirillales bacterium]
MTTETDIRENLSGIRARIADAAEAAGRPADAVTLVAISKAFPRETVRIALAQGHRVFGENRVQEADEKWPALKDEFPDARLHLVGPLQRNKARRAVKLFDVIETIDRAKLARAVAAEIQESGRAVRCFVQVNTGEEPQKGGVLPADADALIAECRADIGLAVDGLMSIPPIDEEPSLH